MSVQEPVTPPVFLPLIIVVGGDNLALQVCAEIDDTAGQKATLLWPYDADLAAGVKRAGIPYVARKPTDDDALLDAGVLEAHSILVLTDNDPLNLSVALKARDLNPNLRIVMRQFNRTLGRKIEQNLKNCSVVSLASQSAATYASAAVDRHCFYGVQFPDIDGPLVGFSRRTAQMAGVSGMSIEEAERHLEARIVAVDDAFVDDRARTLKGKARLWIFSRVRPEVRAIHRTTLQAAGSAPTTPRSLWRALRKSFVRTDPVVRQIIGASLVLVLVATAFFAHSLRLDPWSAAYFVLTTMTTTGYGDIVPHSTDHLEQFGSVVIMLAGLVISGSFIAILSSRLTHAQYMALQGLRRVKRRGHIVVCGSGLVGSRVIDFLLRLRQQVVVIEMQPKSTIVDLSRDRKIDLLTGDATQDTTLDLCNLPQAEALVALTEGDTVNLEVALGARARNAKMPIVMRVQEATFAASIKKHFNLDRTFSTVELAAPVFAGLARSPWMRGEVKIAGKEYAILELGGAGGELPVETSGLVPLCVWREHRVEYVVDLAAREARERMLLLYPLWRLRRRTMQAAAAAGALSPEALAEAQHAAVRALDEA